MQGIRAIIHGGTTTQTLTDLDTMQEFQKYWTIMAENLTEALLTKDLEIPIILER